MASASPSDTDKKWFLQFKCNERVLNSNKLFFSNKIVALMDVWALIAEMNVTECSISGLVEILEWAKLHTLNIILEAEWSEFANVYQTLLEKRIERSKFQLAKSHAGFLISCEKLLIVVKNPWQYPVLLSILKNIEECNGEEKMKFFQMETAYLTSVRLMKLCDSSCVEMAINLATAFLETFYISRATTEMTQTTSSQVWFIFDVLISLLFKSGNIQRVLQMLRRLSLEEGFDLVKRLGTKNIKKMKIWSVSSKVAIYASQIYISQMSFDFSEDTGSVFNGLVKVYYTLCSENNNVSEFVTSIRRISDITNRDGLRRLCQAVQHIRDSSLKQFIIEIFIKIITTDINESETCKNYNDTVKVELVTAELAQTFCELSLLLDDCIEVARECVLTAFSMKPTEGRLKMLEMFAIRSGIFEEPAPIWKCSLHPPVLQTDDLMWICSECGDWMAELQLKTPPENNISLHQIFRTEVLGFSQTLCDDLSVCISYSRYKILSWYQPWTELHRLCVMYLRDPVATKNFITELKFVNIDYSIFKNIKKEPVDELAGIEKGYEMFLDYYNGNSTAVENQKTSNGAVESVASRSTLKEFIIKLHPLQVTTDLVLKPAISLKHHKNSQQILKKKISKNNSNIF